MRNLLLIIGIFFYVELFATEIYFPPILGDSWDTIDPISLGWDTSAINTLFTFLDQKNTKAFIVLKDGKIVLEKYFGTFTKDSNWYWASAGKTLTSALVGIAQEEGLLSIYDKTSKYLGNGWTSCPKEKEDLITIRHQLTMTTGLDYQVEDQYCTNPECLKYKADAGTQWYYHNAPYTLLEKVIVNASGKDYNTFFAQKIRNKIGMNGLWVKDGFNNIYFSTARSMARFGILMLNNGNWNGTDVIKDKNYIQDMINTSQNLNKSYGYLWWLNGKESYMLPGFTKVFNGKLMPDAPDDLYAALGKNGQILNVIPSKGLVLVRMGERPDDQFFISTNFNNDIWKYLNQVINKNTSINDYYNNNAISPNPASDYIEINLDKVILSGAKNPVKIYNTFGECVIEMQDVLHLRDVGHLNRINISHLPVGLYFIQIGNYTEKFMVVR